MRSLLKTATILLTAVLQFTHSVPVVAQPGENRVMIRPQLVPDSMLGVPVEDLLLGERVIGLVADAETTALWRQETILALWKETVPGQPLPTPDQLLRIMSGDLGDTPEDFSVSAVSILGGTPTLELSPVGMLLLGIDGRFFPYCTSILTRPDALLTASHCVSNLHTGETLKAYFPFEGIRDIVDVDILQYCEDPMTGCSKHIDDLAVIKFAPAYTILPSANPGETSDTIIGSNAEILGFGLNDASLSDNGILREGKVILNGCNTCQNDDLDDIDPSAGGRLLCFDYAIADAFGSSINTQGNLEGDSGGPMLAGVVKPNSVIGVSSRIDWRCSDEGDQEGRYVNITNPAYQAWLTNNAFCSPPCPGSSGDVVDLLVHEALKHIGEDSVKDEHQFTVGPWTKKLIITLNHEINGYDPDPNDLELVLPDALNEQCKRYDGVEVCTADKPDFDDYVISVKKNYGNPAYQLAVIAIRCPDQVCWDEFNPPGTLPLPPRDLQAD